MTLALARWGTIIGVGGATAALALSLRAAGIFSAGAATIALQAGSIASGRSWLDLSLAPLAVLPTVPLAAIPALRWDPVAPAILSAAAAGFTAWWLLRSFRALGLGAAAAGALALAVAVHPVWVYAAASGSSAVLAGALVVLGLRLLERWRASGDVLPLAGSSFLIGFAGLVRYDAFVVGLALAAIVALGHRGAADDGRRAIGIGYAAAVVGVIGLWLVVNGLAAGDPLAFIGLAHAASAPPPVADPPIAALLVLVPAVLVALAAFAARNESAAATSVVIIAAAAVTASAVSGSVLSLDAVAPLVPLGALTLGDVARRHAAAAPLVVMGAVALAVCGAGAFATSRDTGEAYGAIVGRLQGLDRPMWPGERDLAAAIRGSSARVLLDPRVDVVPALLSAPAARLVGIADRDARTIGGGDLVVLRTPTGRAATDRVAAAWPTLPDGSATWGALVGAFPVSGEAAEYRLYRVNDGVIR